MISQIYDNQEHEATNQWHQLLILGSCIQELYLLQEQHVVLLGDFK